MNWPACLATAQNPARPADMQTTARHTTTSAIFATLCPWRAGRSKCYLNGAVDADFSQDRACSVHGHSATFVKLTTPAVIVLLCNQGGWGIRLPPSTDGDQQSCQQRKLTTPCIPDETVDSQVEAAAGAQYNTAADGAIQLSRDGIVTQ